MAFRDLKHGADLRHVLERILREGHHHRAQAAGGAQQLKVCCGGHHVLHRLALAQRRVGDQQIGRSAKQHVWPHGLLPAFHVLIGGLVKACRVDALVCQTIHFGIGKGAKMVHLCPIIDQGKLHLLLVAAVGGIADALQHGVDQLGRHVLLQEAAAGMAVHHQSVHHRGGRLRPDRRDAVLRLLAKNGDRALGHTARQCSHFQQPHQPN